MLIETTRNDEAFVSSQSFVFKAKNLYEYAEQELELAEVKLQCCKIRVSNIKLN